MEYIQGTRENQAMWDSQHAPTVQAPMNAEAAYKANQQQYQAILQGYQQQQQQAAQQQQQTLAGYKNLTQSVLGQLRGSQAAAQLGLDNQYQANVAGAQQSLLGRGLGNTTAVEGAMNAAQREYNQANIGLSSQYAGQLAGALGQYGSQALGYQANANQAMQGLQSQQLGYMGQAYGQNNQLYGQMVTGQQNFGYQQQLQNDNAFNQAQLANQNYYLQQAAARQNFGYQQQAADADLGRQNWYDTVGGGYAGD